MLSDTKLPRRQQDLYDLLAGKGDVSITELYEAMGGPNEGDARYAQQWLGSYITKLNRRLAARGLRVTPGRIKNTYALTVVA